MRPATLFVAGALALGFASAAAGQGAVSAPASQAGGDRPSCSTPTIATGAGQVCGLALVADAADGAGRRSVSGYLGIPYAESTAGGNRWRAPVPVKRRDGLFKATAFGPGCPQDDPSPKKAPQSEDCLSLNVWTPRMPPGAGETRGLPVMVFIHGGSFINESNSLPLYDGRHLAASGRTIVVTINYRLGVLGFLAGAEGLTGNYGFLDQQLALRWVRDNIASFGGDPNRVTLFGESAGAMSIGLHLVAPGSRELFHAAIMESNLYGIPYKTPDQAWRFAEEFRLSLGCIIDVAECLRRQPLKAIIAKQTSVMLMVEAMLAGFAGELSWGPVVDGKVIPAQPVLMPIAKPTILGTNLNEGVLFASGQRMSWFGRREVPRIKYEALLELFFSSSDRSGLDDFARYRPAAGNDTEVLSHLLTDYLFNCPNRHVLEQATAPVYAYQFTHVPSFKVWPGIELCAPAQQKVCHADELPFVFGNPTSILRQLTPPDDHFTPAERELSQRTAGYWISFAENRDPNHSGAPQWPAFARTKPVWQVLNTTIAPRTSLDANCSFWRSVGYDVPGLPARIYDRVIK
jgi:carboxylesterase type B